MFGGLERLWVHFVKPTFLLEPIEHRDTPFGYIGKDQGYYRIHGWHSHNDSWRRPVSFGKVFGYDDGDNKELAIYVWEQLEKHFHNEPFDMWTELEKNNKSKVEDFLLEIDLNISYSI